MVGAFSIQKLFLGLPQASTNAIWAFAGKLKLISLGSSVCERFSSLPMFRFFLCSCNKALPKQDPLGLKCIMDRF